MSASYKRLIDLQVTADGTRRAEHDEQEKTNFDRPTPSDQYRRLLHNYSSKSIALISSLSLSAWLFGLVDIEIFFEASKATRSISARTRGVSKRIPFDMIMPDPTDLFSFSASVMSSNRWGFPPACPFVSKGPVVMETKDF
jgi:hypothetical protein